MLSTVDLDIVRQLAPVRADGPTDPDPAMARMIITDGLTGLYNRAYFDQRLALEVPVAQPHLQLALFVIDLNAFKEFNDRHGHQVGDRALQEMAAALQESTPAHGAACRIGGDEFAVLVPGVNDEEAGWLRSEIIRAIGQRRVPIFEGGQGLRISGSVGLALAPQDATIAPALLARADGAMYAAKRGIAVSAGAAAPADPPPLLGRTALLAAATAWLDAAAAGAGQLLLLSGSAGVGKSRLAGAVAEAAAGRGFALVSGQPAGQAPLAEVRRLAGALVGLGTSRKPHLLKHRAAAAVLGLNRGWEPEPGIDLAKHAARDDHAARDLHGVQNRPAVQLPEVVRTLVQLLTAAAINQPLVWFLDDVHQADTATLALLKLLAAELSGLRVLLLLTARTQPAPGEKPDTQQALQAWWTSLELNESCHRCEVPPLPDAEGLELIRWAAGGSISPATGQRLMAVTGGNPLHILRLARASEQEALPGDGPPASLPEVYAAQLAALAERDRHVLYTAAVIGYTLTPEVLIAVAPEDPDTVRRGVETLVAAGWFEQVGNRLRFSHPLARETAYHLVPAGLRRSLHRLGGRELAEQSDSPPPGDLAWHFSAGEDWARARDYHRLAATAAEVALAFPEAAAHYRDYLHLCDALGTPSPDAVELATRAGSFYNMAAESPAAVDILRYALDRCRGEAERVHALLELIYAFCDLGDDEQAGSLCEECLRLLRPRGPSPQLVQLLCRAIGCAVHRNELERIPVLTDELLAAAETAENPVEVVRWLAGAGMCMGSTDEAGLDKVAAAVRQRLRGLRLTPTPATARAVINAASMAGWAGRAAWSAQLARSAIRLGTACGDRVVVSLGHGRLTESLLAAGQVTAAEAELRQTESFSRSKCPIHMRWLTNAIWACRLRHDLTGVAEYARRLDRILGVPIWIKAALAGPSDVALAQVVSGTREAAASEWSVDRLAGTAKPGSPAWINAGEIQVLTGNLAEAARLLALCAEATLAGPAKYRVQWLLGRVLAGQGRWREALRAFTTATHHKNLAFYRACAHRDLAAVLLATGVRGSDAALRRHVAAARRLFSRMGNQHELARLADLERQAPGYPGQSYPPNSSCQTPFAL